MFRTVCTGINRATAGPAATASSTSRTNSLSLYLQACGLHTGRAGPKQGTPVPSTQDEAYAESRAHRLQSVGVAPGPYAPQQTGPRVGGKLYFLSLFFFSTMCHSTRFFWGALELETSTHQH